MEELRVRMKQNCCFIPIFVYRCLGLSVYPDESTLYRIYSAFMILMANLYPWSNLHSVLTNFDNLDVMINALFSWLGGQASAFKIFVLLLNRKNLRNIYLRIERIQEKYNTEEWSQKQVYNMNRMIIIGTIFFFSNFLFLHLATLVARFLNDNSQEWTTPVAKVTFINITYSPNYEIGWLYQSVAVTSCGSMFVVADFLVATILLDLTIQFKILENIIIKTFNGSSITEKKCNERTWEDLDKSVKQIVRHHLYIIELVEDTEKVFSFVIFWDIMGGLSMLCLSVFYSSVVPASDFRAIQSYSEVMIVAATLYFLCYWGSKISWTSECLSTACYEVDFVGTDIRFQRSLLLIMMRSQKRLKLSIGKFADLSIPVFMWIVRTSYSLFMLLHKVN